MTQPSSRDFEQISAYLDGQLSGADAARLESRIKADPELRSVYSGLRQTRSLLRQLPARRAPRNFKLTPQMVGMKTQQRPRIFPFFRLASALAMLLLFLGYAVNLSASSGIQMAAPMGGGIVATEGAYPYDSASSGPAIEETSAAPSELMPAPTEDVAQKLMPLSPTQTAELTPPPDFFAEPTATNETVMMVEPTATVDASMSMQANSATEIMPEATQDIMMMMPYQPEPPALPIPSFWLFGLLGLAVVSGASAFIVEKRASRAKTSTKEIVLIVVAGIVVALLALGIYWMSSPR